MIRRRARSHSRLHQALTLASAALAIAGCASSTPQTGSTQNPPSGSAQSTAGASSVSSAAGSGAATECRGPGRYEAGKEGSYRPCCAGLKEVPYGKPGYTGSSASIPTCDHPPLNVYACVKGECGDGICEQGEAPACGCVADCPQAKWSDEGNPTPPSGAADSGTAECRGPGVYGYGKGAPRIQCCDGLHDFYLPSAGYDADDNRVCVQPIEGQYGCARGECGDGMCEPGEDARCGCSADCPSAAWEGAHTTPANGLRGVPASCEKDDLLAQLEITEASSNNCGELTLEATPDAKLKAAQCARDAWVTSEPFQLFWRTQGTDSVNHSGIYATRGDSGALIVYSVVVDADVFGISLPGATASWWPCDLAPGTTCEGSLEKCLACAPTDRRPVCGCLPEGPRPGTPDGKSVEIQCEGPTP